LGDAETDVGLCTQRWWWPPIPGECVPFFLYVERWYVSDSDLDRGRLLFPPWWWWWR
jgi:hypothetical protein